MRNTAQPISIAYLDDAGGLISVADMTPCADVDGCPTYPAGGSVRWAVEVPAQAGGVDALAIEPGVVVVDTRPRVRVLSLRAAEPGHTPCVHSDGETTEAPCRFGGDRLGRYHRPAN